MTGNVANPIHAQRHAAGGPDAITPEMIGATHGTRWLTLPAGWNTGIKAALANIGSADAGFLWDGTSVLNGGPNLTARSQSIPDLVLAGMITKGYSLHIDGFAPTAHTYCSGTPDATLTPGGYLADVNAPFSALANTGATQYQVDHACFGRAFEPKGSTAGTFSTSTSNTNCTGADFVFAGILPSGVFTITADTLSGATVSCTTPSMISVAGNVITVTNHGPNGWGGNPVDKISIRGLTAGVHTFAVNNPTVANRVVWGWLNLVYGTSTGLAWMRNGNAGSLAVDEVLTSHTQSSPAYNGRTVVSGNRDRYWTNGVAGINGTNGCYLTASLFGYPAGCNILIDDSWLNDESAGVSVEAWASAKNRKWRAMRRAVPDMSIIALIPSYPDGLTSDDPTPGRGLNKAQMKSAAYNLAAQYNAAVVDIDAKWGSTGVAQGFQLNTGDLHPTVAGAADIAAQILACLY